MEFLKDHGGFCKFVFRKDKKEAQCIDHGVSGVICTEYRVAFYLVAILDVISILSMSILVLWFDICDAGTLHKSVYVLLAAATIPFIVLLLSCMCTDVAVPSYRLGAKERFRIYLTTMVLIYCITFGIQDKDVKMEMSLMAIISITGAIAILQLHCPAEDFDPDQIGSLMLLGTVSAILGWVATESWFLLFGSLFTFVFLIFFVDTRCLEADLYDEEQRRRHPLLPVSLRPFDYL